MDVTAEGSHEILASSENELASSERTDLGTLGLIVLEYCNGLVFEQHRHARADPHRVWSSYFPKIEENTVQDTNQSMRLGQCSSSYTRAMTALRDQPERRMTPQEYLAFEEQSDERHEYEDGHLYAMAGESMRHEDVVLNVVDALRCTAREKGCRLDTKTIKLRISGSTYYYPDVFVTCPDRGNTSILENPCFVLEVLSPSTSWRARSVKQDAYLELPSLEKYVVVNPNERHVVVYTRTIKGWMYEAFTNAGEIEIPCLETRLTLEQIYVGIELDVRIDK